MQNAYDKNTDLPTLKPKEIGTNGGNIFKNMDFPEFSIHYYRQNFTKIGTPDKITSFSPFSGVKIGTVPLK